MEFWSVAVRRVRKSGMFALLLLGMLPNALAVQGPVKAPLQVKAIYLQGGIGAVYVEFQSGAMPGCYNSAGGYLMASNGYFKEIYAMLLSMVASGGARATVIYTQNVQTGNWGDCTIDGIYLLPE